MTADRARRHGSYRRDKEQEARRFIVKVQIPLVTNAPPGKEEFLAYNRDRSFQVMLPLTQALRETMRGEFKMFFFARLKDEVLHLEGIAPWQGW